jgi:hypothetical protein
VNVKEAEVLICSNCREALVLIGCEKMVHEMSEIVKQILPPVLQPLFRGKILKNDYPRVWDLGYVDFNAIRFCERADDEKMQDFLELFRVFKCQLAWDLDLERFYIQVNWKRARLLDRVLKAFKV